MKHTKSNLSSFLYTAKKLQRISKNGSISQVMPIIRRLHISNIFYGKPISQIYNERQTLQRKHFLRLLAIESGFKNWEKLKPALDNEQQNIKMPITDNANDVSIMKLWCSSESEAMSYVSKNGGKVISYGNQAMVLLTNNQ